MNDEATTDALADAYLDERHRSRTNLQRFRLLRIALVATLAVIVLIVASIANAEVFALQPGNDQAKIPLGQRGSTRITEAELRLVDGNTIRIRPQWISKNGRWDFSFPDSCVATCRKLNKKYTLLLMGGASNPTSTASLTFYDAAWKELGRRYASDPLCVGVHPGVPPAGHSEELFWGRPMPTHAMAANKRMISVAVAAFPRQMIIIAGSANDPAAMRELIRYGVAIAPGRFVYKINSLSAKSDLNWIGTGLVVEAAKSGADFGFEMLDASSASRFGGTWQQAMAKKSALESRAGKKAVYLAKYRGDIK
jgi:hypothetical protein